MKTPDEIKKGLFCCWEDGCATCPYDDDCTMGENFMDVAKDAHAYIQQLESDNENKQKRIDELVSRLAEVERERDAAVADLSDRCQYCKHISCDDEDENSPCKDCMQRKGGVPFAPMIRTCFEWRGVCEENTGGGNK